MTDKEIEGLLSDLSEFTCPNVDISIHSMAEYALDYINRLKAENRRLKAYDHERDMQLHARLIESTRKDTAENFAETLIALLWEENKGETITIKDLHTVIKDVAKAQYGVEVDK